ncbi:WD repeat-containing protein 43 isoform X2 [Capsicum chacoense]|uniref:WD repeat-containing protein 43 isoform X2 n=1 Tax=Capsicum annuum TaxID=4072 RepID=UPI0007BF437C|nr:WD repeat-containing protein 43 isoform X2 [Capsicum annuum]KAF3625589.1 putative leucine-rich repeat and IQ domain-containing protein 4-like [Capsicum annuum]KAF3658131.1 putative leucine-rich repeat and IQ domain-containing protein 4-like [Capsicum annuum]
MGSTNIRDILSCLSPSLDLFAISSGDGRIKIWDTVKGQIQTEFADIVSTETESLFTKPGGHLSIDYTCMKWLLSCDRKKKRKLGTSLLILGTGSGDVSALDVSAGHLKWKFSDCHPGGVSAISFPSHGSFIYTAGADGLVCQIDSMSGNLLHKFKASTKAISSLSVSSDGKILATATSQLKIFNCFDDKRLQKFSGHPGAVRCMVFSEDGRHILSSSVGDRHVAVWKLDGSKKNSACCLLAMDHPPVLLDSYCIKSGDENDASLGVLAISEIGVCYFWHGKSFEELHNGKPTKICIALDEKILKKHKEAVPSIFSAKLQSISKSGSGHMFIAYGSLIKPSFEKVMVQPGADIRLKSSLDGILLFFNQSRKSKQASSTQSQVTALDRANAEGALLPLPKILDQVGVETGIKPTVSKDVSVKQGEDEVTICMEDQLRSLGIISNDYELSPTSILDDKVLKRISGGASVPQKKMKAAILSMEPHDAYNLLKALVDAWQSRSSMGIHVLPWICCIMVNHNEFVTSQEPLTPLLDSMNKLSKSKVAALNYLLQLSGRLQLVMAQIEKADNKKAPALTLEGQMDESEDDEVDEVMYGRDVESQTSSDGDD